MYNSTWIPEREAAAMLGYSSLQRFRKNVKSRKIAIGYRSTNQRFYQYHLRDLKKYMASTALMMEVA